MKLDGGNHYFLLMEYCEHGSLSDLLEELRQNDERLTLEELKLIFGQIAIAQKYLHYNMNFIHRDIKSENILIKRKNPLEIRFVDFGFARSIDTLMQSNVGTPTTLDVRILSGQSYDATSDLHSIGSVLYALLHNHYPTYDCFTEVEMIEMYQYDEVRFDKHILQDKQFKPVISLCEELLNPSERKIKYTWESFYSNAFVIECMEFAEKVLRN